MYLNSGGHTGPEVTYLQGKIVFNSITTGGNRSAYSKEGHNRFTIKELLAPFEQTAFLCKMNYLPPFVVHGTHRISTQEKDLMAQKYHKILERFVTNDFSVEDVKKYSCLNDWMDSENSKKTIYELSYTGSYLSSAAVICVPVAKKLGMGSVLGYLIAGMIIGPFALGFIGKEGEDIMHFAEFGVVMMLFLIGLELEPSQFWNMRKSIVGMGSTQLILTSLSIFILMIILGLAGLYHLRLPLLVQCLQQQLCCRQLRKKGCPRLLQARLHFPFSFSRILWLFPYWPYFRFLHLNLYPTAALSSRH